MNNNYFLEPQRILLSGSQGFVGKALKSFLQDAGHTVICLKRSVMPKKEAGSIFWDPSTGRLVKDDFERFDAVIHLAGENIAKGRWTKKRKDRIFQSRVRDTWLLSQVLLRLCSPPKTVICASAIGYYGDRGIEMLNEKSPAGCGFLADLCKKWEEALDGIKNRGSRVVHARFGIILGREGGMLKKIPPLILGKEEQIISWIALEDVLGALYHCLALPEIEGPVNFTSPYPVTQLEFVNTIHKKAYFHIPSWLLKLFLGEMAKELLLSSTLAYPEVLMKTGYRFRCPNLREVILRK